MYRLIVISKPTPSINVNLKKLKSKFYHRGSNEQQLIIEKKHSALFRKLNILDRTIHSSQLLKSKK